MADVRYYQKLFKELKQKGAPASILLLYGTESYLIQTAISKLEEFYKTKRISFWAKEVEIKEIKTNLLNSGLFQKNRIIVVYEAEHLKKIEELIALKPPKNNILVLIPSYTLEKRTLKNLLRRVKKYRHLKTFEFTSLDEKSFKIWVNSKFKAAGKVITSEILDLLIRLLPRDLETAKKEIDKIILYMGEDLHVSEDHFRVLTPQIESDLTENLIKYMGHEHLHIDEIMKSALSRNFRELLYELELHTVRIIDIQLNTWFSDKYQQKWKLTPYKSRLKMLPTNKDAIRILERLLNIEYTSKTKPFKEEILKDLSIMGLIP